MHIPQLLLIFTCITASLACPYHSKQSSSEEDCTCEPGRKKTFEFNNPDEFANAPPPQDRASDASCSGSSTSNTDDGSYDSITDREDSRSDSGGSGPSGTKTSASQSGTSNTDDGSYDSRTDREAPCEDGSYRQEDGSCGPTINLKVVVNILDQDSDKSGSGPSGTKTSAEDSGSSNTDNGSMDSATDEDTSGSGPSGTKTSAENSGSSNTDDGSYDSITDYQKSGSSTSNTDDGSCDSKTDRDDSGSDSGGSGPSGTKTSASQSGTSNTDDGSYDSITDREEDSSCSKSSTSDTDDGSFDSPTDKKPCSCSSSSSSTEEDSEHVCDEEEDNDDDDDDDDEIPEPSMCGGIREDGGGFIESPRYPYPSRRTWTCQWKIICECDQYLWYFFHEFDMAEKSSGTCTHQYLDLRANGTDLNIVTDVLCDDEGKGKTDVLYETDQHVPRMGLKYFSRGGDTSDLGKGFRLEYMCVDII